jgi:hypothetical protein
MKRLIIVLLIFFAITIVAVYVFIPNQISFGKSVLVNVNRDGLSRKLYDEKQWSQWWPGTVDKNATTKRFVYNNSSFTIDKLTMGTIFISIADKNRSVPSALNIVWKNTDTTELAWAVAIPTSFNPFKRFQIYFESNKIADDIDHILRRLQSYFSKIKNVYDYDIKRGFVTDSFLVSTFATSRGYPSIDFSYHLIDRLKKYIADNGAKESGFPMLNVSTNDSITYLTRVGIPVDRMVPSSKEISFKRMPAGGNMLVVDIKGGPASANNALHQAQNFILDYHESAPAIPFFSLITDRRKESDTSRWQTRIYYPVM